MTKTPDTALTLEQQLADIVRKHGLISLTFTAHDTDDGVEFYSNAQALHGTERLCGSTDRWCAKASAAIAQAVDDLNAQRGIAPATLAPIEGLAA